MMWWPQETFEVGGSFIYGRADDIYGITKLIYSEDGSHINSYVLSVVADRGTGRTTMLHILHNELCNTFDIAKYICMPKTSDEKRIIRLIIESLTGCHCDIADLDVLKETVKEELIDQKFLLLLDDFENRSQKCWDLLFALLKISKEESVVVVTATHEAVPKVKGPMQFYYMNNLSTEWCWMIFKQGVFSGQNPEDAKLAEIGKCLIEKCKNVTLCIKVLSGIMRHSIDADRWRAVLDDNFWEMDEVDGDILPALRVSYEYMPFHLKQCFKYCSLFPKGYIFSKQQLVRMWLSQGFIEPDEGRELEVIGVDYFDQLLSRSFLQVSHIPDMKKDGFVMSGLIHDLAQQLSKNECFRFEGYVERAPANASHLALVPHEFQSMSLSHLITRAQNLLTILIVSGSTFQYQSVSSSILKLAELENVFIKFQRLITLDLSNSDIDELPKSVGSLNNLRYLSLSSTNIKRIPLEISNLIHLQTLEAKNCHYLGELPITIDALTNLHYLDVTKETGYVVMPCGIGELTNLRSLATFNVGTDSLLHCGIKELKGMKHLKGCLEISGLVNVRSEIDAKKADLRSKEYIETLCLQWSDGMSYLEGEEGAEIAGEVLESLQPTENLNEIIIRNYPGKGFPTWIECAAFSRLVSVIFDNCNNCERLPALGGLPLLRFLSIQKMYCVERMSLTRSEYIPENIIRYPSLEKLIIWEMYELVEWIEIGNGHFPVLHSLCINRCPLLKNVPKFPALIELSIYSCAQFLEAIDLPSLQSLRIEGLHKIRSFIMSENLVRLNKLEISHCPELLSIEGLPLLKSLEKIIIFKCTQMNSSGILDERLFAYENKGNTRVSLRKKKIVSSEKLNLGTSAFSNEPQEHANLRVPLWDFSADSSSSLFDSSEEGTQYLSSIDDSISISSEKSFPTSYWVHAESSLQLNDQQLMTQTVDDSISLSSEKSFLTSYWIRAESSLQLTMSRLEDEFRNLLSHSTTGNTVPYHSVSLRLMSPSIDEVENSFALPNTDAAAPYLVAPDTILDLKEIALRMIAADYGPELCQAYSETRREALMDCLASLGINKMSIEDVQKIDWRTLDSKMKNWTQALKFFVNGVLLEEKRVCESVFESSMSLKDECFAKAAKGCVLQFFNFGDAISIAIGRTSEQLFRTIGMYEALAEVLPDLESLFSGHDQVFIKEAAERILSQLGDAIKGIILEFGNFTRGESKKPMQYGEIHPLTRYVMNYVRLLADYTGTLNRILSDEDSNGSDKGTGADKAEGANLTPLGNCMLTLITYLETNLDEKKKLYNDVALQHIFIMNNLLYIVQKVMNSEMKTLLDDNWVRKKRNMIMQHSIGYLRASWTRVLSFLAYIPDPGSGFSNKNGLKETFKNFNKAIENIYQVQKNWRVPDRQLREELQLSICEKLSPAYRSFYGRHVVLFDGRSAKKYIKYTTEDLEKIVYELFEAS